MFHDGSPDIICADQRYNLVQILGRLILCHVRTVFIFSGPVPRDSEWNLGLGVEQVVRRLASVFMYKFSMKSPAYAHICYSYYSIGRSCDHLWGLNRNVVSWRSLVQCIPNFGVGAYMEQVWR